MIAPGQVKPGDRFGMLVAMRHVAEPGRGRLIECRCDCGRLWPVLERSLRRGDTKSCGCTPSGLRHGYARRGQAVPEYRIWQSMRARCRNPNDAAYANYGGRGIRVAARWCGPMGFANFMADMGPRPSPKHSLDRIDNGGDYRPGNVRWATQEIQHSNTRRNVRFTIRGETRTQKEWCLAYGISVTTVIGRLKLGWDPERALSTPPDPSRSRKRGAA